MLSIYLLLLLILDPVLCVLLLRKGLLDRPSSLLLGNLEDYVALVARVVFYFVFNHFHSHLPSLVGIP